MHSEILTDILRPWNTVALAHGRINALKGTHFQFLFAITAFGVVPCSSPKKSPRTSSILQIAFSFWSFEISMGILAYQN